MLGITFLWSGIATAQNSLYRDVKAKQIGDVITVVLQESTSGSSTSDTKQSTSSDGMASGSMSGSFLPFEPTFGSGVNVNYGADQKNLSSQRQLLEGYISVQIVEVTQSGDLLVKGNRMTEVNGEVHKMSLSGIVRQNDVDSQNQVLSYRIADANISYQKMGGLRDKKKDRGLLKKIVFTGITAAMGAAMILRELQRP
jgi:flagellar L-ring protein precursor FlgH